MRIARIAPRGAIEDASAEARDPPEIDELRNIPGDFAEKVTVVVLGPFLGNRILLLRKRISTYARIWEFPKYPTRCGESVSFVKE